MMNFEKLKCRVCYGIASGFNYSGLSCESCKVFFCRNSSRLESFRCDYGDNCEIDMSTRRYCAKCRLVKCFAIGMKKKKTYKNNLESKLTNRIENIMQISILRNITQFETVKPFRQSDNIANIDLHMRRLLLNQYDVECITEARNAISIFRDESTAKVITRITNVLELAASPPNLLYIKKTIKFCQKFRVFNSLPNEDQLALLKPAHVHVTSIWSAFHYDAQRKGFLTFVDESETSAMFIGTDILAQCFPKDVYHLMKNNSIGLYNALENDVNIRDLTCALALFKTQRNLSNPENIRYHYHLYCSILQRYLLHKHQNKANQRYLALMHLLDQFDLLYKELRKFVQPNTESIPKVFLELYDLV